MTITPPGDILMDVARAADPQRLSAAQARLDAHAAGSAPAIAFDVSATASQRVATAGVQMPEHYVQFESMVLQNFLETMLPEEAGAVYGEGLAGEMWRSLLAQEIGNSMARRGGIGIATRVLGDHTLEDDKKVPVSGVSAGRAAETAAVNASLAAGLVEEIERQTAKSLAADVAQPAGNAK